MRLRTKKHQTGLAALAALLVAVAVSVAPLAFAPPARAQAPTPQAPATRYLGTVTAISGDTLTVKTDAGQVNTVEVPSSAQLKRITPGQTDLSKAESLDFGSIAVGDRVLVNLDPNSTVSTTGGTPQALRVIAIKKADVAQKQQSETAQWNQGVHGLVKSVDAAAGVIQVSVRVGAVTKEVAVDTTTSTVLKRYAPGSVRFDQAQPAPITSIQPGDQLWARGTKSADGSSIAADGIVSGSFLSIAGTILSTDITGSTVTVKDLATKKPVTVHITGDAQLQRLPDTMAAFLAARLKGGQAGGPGGGQTGRRTGRRRRSSGWERGGKWCRRRRTAQLQSSGRRGTNGPRDRAGTRAADPARKFAERRSGDDRCHRRFFRRKRGQAARRCRTTARSSASTGSALQLEYQLGRFRGRRRVIPSTLLSIIFNRLQAREFCI